MSFTYRGITSDSMHFNVTERQVYNAPAFDVNEIEVPGRDGNLLNSQNRFSNKTITYTGFLRNQDFPGDTARERLSRGLRELKAWICGDAGHYHDLTDDYDPGYIRRAFISGETAINEIHDRPDGVTLTITFRAEPFMYLEGNPFNVPETGTKSGDIATFTGVDAPLQSLIFNIEPVQDLHGYANPWPGGGGKNLLPLTVANIKALNTGGTWSGNSYTQSGVTFTVNTDSAGNVTSISTSGTASANVALAFTANQSGALNFLPTGTYKANGCPSGASSTTFEIQVRANDSWYDVYTSEVQFSYTNGGSGVDVCRIRILSGTNVTGKVFYPMIRLSTDTGATFAPYSNICPISGWTEVKGWHSGKNILSNSMAEVGTAWNGTSNSARARLVVQCKPSTKYTLSMNGTSSMSNIFRQDSAVVPASSVGGDITNLMPYTFTTGANSKYIILAFSKTSMTQGDIDALKLQLEEGATNTPYESTATPYTVSFGQTVYGGTLDAIAGKCVVETQYFAPGNTVDAILSSSTSDVAVFDIRLANMDLPSGIAPIISDRFSTTIASNTPGRMVLSGSHLYCVVLKSELQSVDGAGFKTWCATYSPQFVYHIATPVEVDITPVTDIETLLGENNVWADAGQVEVTYIDPTDNPTGFASKPFWEITMSGAGTLTVNGKTWSIGAYTGTLYCDTDIMDWYNSSSLQNDLVSGSDFPELQPGENIIYYTGGITKVKVTPRWRAL